MNATFHSFAVDFKEKHLQGYVHSLAGSAWIWVGERSIQSLGLAAFPLFTMLVEGPGGQREFVKSLTLRLTKNLGIQQVFFSTDLQEEDAEYWNELYGVLLPQLSKFLKTQPSSD
ncbi:hypothetical protein WR25_19021 [Diploscapter pachys]|uniref:Uncharacterized protein n=1 Tax=Diploscapter pachys TaxID=2018661 RepID=A0A2A2KFR1_9BILA|nr:hypothetical protein WR25_19021 [Diploscapter pachys]